MRVFVFRLMCWRPNGVAMSSSTSMPQNTQLYTTVNAWSFNQSFFVLCAYLSQTVTQRTHELTFVLISAHADIRNSKLLAGGISFNVEFPMFRQRKNYFVGITSTHPRNLT